MRYFFSLIFLIVGCGMLYITYTQYIASTDLLKHGTRVTGTVIDNIESEDEDGEIIYTPVVEFTYEGLPHEFESDMASYPPVYETGAAVEVIHPKEHPEEAIINDFISLWLLAIILGIFGGVFTLIGGIMLWHTFQKAQNIGESSPLIPASGTPPPSGPINPMK